MLHFVYTIITNLLCYWLLVQVQNTWKAGSRPDLERVSTEARRYGEGICVGGELGAHGVRRGGSTGHGVTVFVAIVRVCGRPR